MKKMKKVYCKVSIFIAVLMMIVSLTLFFKENSYAASVTESNNNNTSTDATNDTTGLHFNLGNDSATLSGSLKILIFLTIISLAPAILIMLTSFTRIIVVLHFLRTAMGTQTTPPNQILVGLALFLTLFIMSPIFTRINEEAIKPLDETKITAEEALERGLEPLREFMFTHTQLKDLSLFCEIAGMEVVDINTEEEFPTEEQIPTTVLIPSFIISELKTAFIIGFLVYLPFIVIDMVVASVLMSMGMMMLPPATIAMPFKILLFIMADGWELIIGNLVKTFY